MLCHLAYLQNFSKTWPFISLSNLTFVASCVLVILDHFAWFFYFSNRAKETGNSAYAPRHRPASYRGPRYGADVRANSHGDLTFMDVATFFGVCVWLVPFFLFLSLSANDNVLPSLGEQTPQTKSNSASTSSPLITSGQGVPLILPPVGHRSSILKVALDPLLSLIPRIGRGTARSSRSQREGLIASPRVSAPPSPSLYGQTSPSPFGDGSSWSSSQAPPSPIMSISGSHGVGYDPSSLSPQTPFSNRFGEASSLLRKSPQLRQPPSGLKRSITSPPSSHTSPIGGLSNGDASHESPPRISLPSRGGSPPPLQFRVAGSVQDAHISASDTEGPSTIRSVSGSSSSLPRSASPAGISSAGASGVSAGLVSRRRGNTDDV